jgi:uncharacterized repeat protein (TIGR01451 family)
LASLPLGVLCALVYVLLLPVSTESAAAQAQISFVSAAGNWHDAQDDVPGSQPGEPVITNGVPTSSISWGTTTGAQSGYDFTIAAPPPQTLPTTTPLFPLGTFSHRNFPIGDPSLTTVQLDVVLVLNVDGVQTPPLTFTFTFNHDETPNNTLPCPYPTPPGEGCTDRVTFAASPQPTTFNVGGVNYTLSMSFLDASGNPVSEFITREGGLVNTSSLVGQFTVVPPELTATKSGPAAMTVGQWGAFGLDIQNTGLSDAWNATVRDVLPDGPTGGMCDATPEVLSARVFAADGVTPVPGKGPLAAGIDYAISYTGAPSCALSLTMLTPAGVISQGERLIVSYRTQLDAGSQDGVALTNVAGATEWFSSDSNNPARLTYTRSLSDGTPAVLDHQDAHTVTVQMPSLFAAKSVALLVDAGAPNVVDPGDVLHYTIRIDNSGAGAATGVELQDGVPANTTYVANSTTLNGQPVARPDGGAAPLAAGIPISSSNLTPPLPGAGMGQVSPGASAVLEFDLQVNAGVPAGTIISNQAVVHTNERPDLLTDGDGNPATGPEPTVVVVGNGQQLLITKQVAVVGGGAALPGATLEYTVAVQNVALVPAYNVVITDDLDAATPGRLAYVASSAMLNGSATGVTVAGSLITADYFGAYGPLPSGQTIVLRFRATIAAGLAQGTILTNIGTVTWNTPPEMASASVSIAVGGMTGVGALNGTVWHDADFDRAVGASERLLEGWIVALLRNGQLVQSVQTDAAGSYRIAGVAPTDGTTDRYTIRFQRPGAGPNTASLGRADSPYTNGIQEITDIAVAAGSNLQGLNLPIQPNGVVYGALARAPIAGATLSLLSDATGAPLPASCFLDGAQQGQVTLADGWYKFDLSFGDCPLAGGGYLLAVTPPSAEWAAGPSQVIRPTSDASTAAFSVPACPGSVDDAISATPQHCEAQASELAPPASVPPTSPGTKYYLHLLFDGSAVPGSSQIFNNHIPLDPMFTGSVTIAKSTPLVNVTRGQLVPYEIELGSALAAVADDVRLVDHTPPGFRYVEGSARLDGDPAEPRLVGRDLVWDQIPLPVGTRRKVQLLLAVGAGVGEGEHVNRAEALSRATGVALSGAAKATVRVVPDPTFDCTDVIGKVFDDANRNGRQDRGERGLAGVRLVTARGLIATTDPFGRFHITCAVTPNEARGSNFALKLDDRTLPSGYRLSTKQTQVQRATRGKALRFHFGASIYRVVGLDLADDVFEPGTTRMRPQWEPRLSLLLDELHKEPAILRLSYMGDVEDPSLVGQRLDTIKQRIEQSWSGGAVQLAIETEVFWRRGGDRLGDAGWKSLLPAWGGNPPVVEREAEKAVERQLPSDEPLMQWSQDPERLATESGDRVERREIASDRPKTVKLTNVVPPIRFESGVAKIPEDTVERLRSVLADMRQRRNVRLHLVGHADDQPLSARLTGIFGDNEGLSRERSGEVAEFLQRALSLPPESISFEWAGDADPVASNDTAAGRAANRRVEVEVWYDEAEPVTKVETVVVPEEIKRFKVCRTETVCKLRYREGEAHRARVRNLIAPLHYGEAGVEVTEAFLGQVKQALQDLAKERNVTVKFVGFSDDAPLTGRDARIYGTAQALSTARARRVALAVQDALKLPTAAVASEGRGASQPLASSATERGRALNRRIEVELWYDDPLQDLPDEPQPCPDEGGEQWVTRVYEPPWGSIAPMAIDAGDVTVAPGVADMLRRALADIADKPHARLRFVGYTANERLDRRTALVYGDDIGLSADRARRAMEKIRGELGLSGAQVEHEGRGYVTSDDVVNAGFVQGDTSQVIVQAVYDERLPLDDGEGIEATPLTRELRAKNPLALNLMRITRDGEPIDDPNRDVADIQRCTDVALERADIRFRFDDLESAPRLSVTSSPSSVTIGGTGSGPAAEPVRFRMYTNYAHFIARSEVRVFAPEQSLQATPLAAIAVDPDGLAEWQPDPSAVAAPLRELKYVLRAYDASGRFDETAPQSLWLIRGGAGTAAPAGGPGKDALLAGYGETGALKRSIPLGSAGAVEVHGSGIPAQHTVWVAGSPVPVDEHGDFVAEAILPSGLHTVEVAVLDPAGNGELYLRDLELQKRDWFYVGMADLTLSQSRSSGPADRLEGNDAPYDPGSLADGSVAFFVTGKFGEDYRLTASVDTREGPLEDVFSNFLDKSPESLFRRIDPDYHLPTFGDDGSVEEGAPTTGKFFARLDKGASHLLWGNFGVGYLSNEVAQVDRGLYGASLHYQSPATTPAGEQRLVVDAFAAQPGTVPSREEFRVTGGSLYWLSRQDLLSGSERLRIEMRDKDTGLVSSVVHLQPNVDYDIDYLQGRILLSEPIASTVEDALLVRSQGLSGSEAWLVVQYEYSPGLDEIDALTFGGQGEYWLKDWIKLGVTANRNQDGGVDSNLFGGDVTLRKSEQSWIKLQAGHSEGLVSSALFSEDGGFDFFGQPASPAASAGAGAYRADVSVGVSDFLKGRDGRLSFYYQTLDGGYSGPGMSALTDTDFYGGLLDVPFTQRLHLAAKADRRLQQSGLETTAQEVDLGYQLTQQWKLSAGVRNDMREDGSPVVPVTQEEGSRTDAVVQAAFASGDSWRGYSFAQATLARSGDREENRRLGFGGAHRFGERLLLDGEVSYGDLGPAVKLGTTFQESEQSQRYVSYALENELPDDGLHERRGSLISGARTRLSDSASVYMEDRLQRGDSANGLTRTMGVSLAPTERWSLGANWGLGTLINPQTDAETKRRAGGARVGYAFESVQLSSGLEYRFDETEATDGTWSDRTTWLFRNSFKLQMTPDWQVVGKLNHSFSDSSLGQFYDGDFTEAVLGYAYRPVDHDRWNALAKYTYFYNLPGAEQLTAKNLPVEFSQRSHIASLDVSYDVTPSWSVGGKYAYRLGEMSLDRAHPDFLANDAHLFILRNDLRFRTSWEASLEARLLQLPDFDERRAGALITVYRYLGDHIKVGVGYNFTDFSDDLTDLSYDDQGFFLNLVGAL